MSRNDKIQRANGKDRFLGAWKLVSYEYRDQEGRVSYPFGENTGGIIMYDASGYMAVQIIRNDRPAFASEDMFDAAPEELKTAFEGINSYFGRFEVDVKQGIVIHHVEAASLPNRHGSHQVRQYEFSGNRLILKTPPRLLNGQMLTGILIWERIEAT